MNASPSASADRTRQSGSRPSPESTSTNVSGAVRARALSAAALIGGHGSVISSTNASVVREADCFCKASSASRRKVGDKSRRMANWYSSSPMRESSRWASSLIAVAITRSSRRSRSSSSSKAPAATGTFVSPIWPKPLAANATPTLPWTAASVASASRARESPVCWRA